MTHLHPSYEPHRLSRLAGAFLMAMLALGTVVILIGLTGAAVLVWQQVIG